MDVLTDPWVRRLKTVLEHATRKPINTSMAELDRLTYNSPGSRPYSYWSSSGGGIMTATSRSVHVSPGTISAQEGDNVVEIHVPTFDQGELGAVIDLLTDKIGYFLLLTTWTGTRGFRSNHDVNISPAEQKSIKLALETALIERGIHVVPRSAASIQITCTCSGSTRAEAMTTTTGRPSIPPAPSPDSSPVPTSTGLQPSTRAIIPLYCQHVMHLLPFILKHLDVEPWLVFHLRGYPANDLLSRMWEHLAVRRGPGGILGPSVNAGTVSPSCTAANVIDEEVLKTFWTYPGTGGSLEGDGDTSHDLPIPERRPVEMPIQGSTTQPLAWEIPSYFPPILASVYSHVRLHETVFRQILATLEAKKKHS